MVDHPYPHSRPLRIVGPMLAMLICGLSLGAGGMTLYWSGVADRGFKREAEYSIIAKRFEVLARENLALANRNLGNLNECLTLVKSR